MIEARATLGDPLWIPVFIKAVRAGFPSPADDYLDAPIDLSRALVANPSATFIMTVSGDSAVDIGIFDGSMITVDRSLKPRNDDPVVVDVNGERSVKVFKIDSAGPRLAYGNRRYGEYDPGPEPVVEIFGVITNAVRRFRK